MTVETAKHYRQLAQKYRGYGFNLVPLGADKRPAETGVSPSGSIMRFRWDDWQQTKQSDTHWALIKKHEWWVSVGGIAGVCGPVSDDLVCIDFDTPKDSTGSAFPFELLERFLQGVGLTDSLWIVDTPRGGFHVWARCGGLEIEKGKLDRPALGLPDGYHIELRWTGHYAALPESHHPNGVPASADNIVAGWTGTPGATGSDNITLTGACFVSTGCYANCDGSTAVPLLTANDFQCFLNKYAQNDPYANCDGSTAIPVLTANDFQCFLNKYAVGCT
jgi:hypothetical protein